VSESKKHSGPTLAWSAALALVLSGFAAVRNADVVALPVGWIAAWGPLALVVGLCAASLRLVEIRSRAVTTLGITAIVAFGPLALFGELLKRATHHRPLGAVTFAVLGAAVLVLAMVIIYRLVQAAGEQAWWGVLARAALYAIGVGGALLGGALVVLASSGDSAGPLRSGLLDTGLTVVAIAVATWAPPWWWARRPALSIGFWGSALVASALVLAVVPASRQALSRTVPALLPLAGWLGG